MFLKLSRVVLSDVMALDDFLGCFSSRSEGVDRLRC